MFEFTWPWLLLCLPLPLVIYWLMPARPVVPNAALRVANVDRFPGQTTSVVTNTRSRLMLAAVVWLLLVIASARPLWLGDPMPSPTQARELILAVDLSASMAETDMELNGRWVDRLTMVKAVLAKFIEQRQGDRIGLILFADNAYVQAPLTFDLATVKQLLDESSLGLVGKRTAIGDAIGLSVKRFDRRDKNASSTNNKDDNTNTNNSSTSTSSTSSTNKKNGNSNRVLVLLTDGENTAGNLSLEQALELAIAKQVTIYTIGVGSNRSRGGFFNQGSGIDERALTAIAQATQGQYFRATDSRELQRIYQHLDQLEKIEVSQQILRQRRALFYWPLALALLLSFAGIALRLRQGGLV